MGWDAKGITNVHTRSIRAQCAHPSMTPRALYKDTRTRPRWGTVPNVVCAWLAVPVVPAKRTNIRVELVAEEVPAPHYLTAW